MGDVEQGPRPCLLSAEYVPVWDRMIRRMFIVEDENEVLLKRQVDAADVLTGAKRAVDYDGVPELPRDVVVRWLRTVNWRDVHTQSLSGGGFSTNPGQTLLAILEGMAIEDKGLGLE